MSSSTKHRLSPRNYQNNTDKKRQRVHRLIPKRYIPKFAKDEFEGIINEIKSFHQLIGMATISRAIALRKLFDWIKLYYGDEKSSL